MLLQRWRQNGSRGKGVASSEPASHVYCMFMIERHSPMHRMSTDRCSVTLIRVDRVSPVDNRCVKSERVVIEQGKILDLQFIAFAGQRDVSSLQLHLYINAEHKSPLERMH
jgi:hypothetical protein